MTRMRSVVVGLALALWLVPPAGAQPDTLAKIKETGVLTIGTRTGSPPFAYVNKNNEWVGFSIDLVEQLVKPSVEKAVGRAIKVEKKESTPPTRIPLLSSNAVDLIAGTMTDTPQRREVVDFSLTFFYTGAQFLVKKGSPIKGVNDLAGKRVAAQQGATNAKILREKYPQAQLREFPDQPAAFQALLQGQVDAYTNDGIQLYGSRPRRPSLTNGMSSVISIRRNPTAWPCARATPSSRRPSTPASRTASSPESISRSTRSGSGRRASCRIR